MYFSFRSDWVFLISMFGILWDYFTWAGRIFFMPLLVFSLLVVFVVFHFFGWVSRMFRWVFIRGAISVHI